MPPTLAEGLRRGGGGASATPSKFSAGLIGSAGDTFSVARGSSYEYFGPDFFQITGLGFLDAQATVFGLGYSEGMVALSNGTGTMAFDTSGPNVGPMAGRHR